MGEVGLSSGPAVAVDVDSLLKRFSEPSSYAGIAGVLYVLGLNVPDGVVKGVVYVFAGACSVAAFFLKEKHHSTAEIAQIVKAVDVGVIVPPPGLPPTK